MTLTLDLQTPFKITEHPFLKSKHWVKYEQDSAKGKEDMRLTIVLRRTDGRKYELRDGQTDTIGRPQS